MTPLGKAIDRIRPAVRHPDYRPPGPGDVGCADCMDEGRIFCHRTRTAFQCACVTRRAAASAQEVRHAQSNLSAWTDTTFATLLLAGPPGAGVAYPAAHRAAHEYADTPTGMFTIAGRPATGKTSLAVAIGNRMLELGRSVLWVKAGDIIRAIRQETAPHDPVRNYRECTHLIVDDIPATPATAWEKEQLLAFLSHRDDNRLPTVCILRGLPQQADDDITAKICRNDARCRFHVLGQVQPSHDGRHRPPPPAMALAMTFDSYHTGTPHTALSVAKRTAFDWSRSPSGWLCLSGGTGAGKTHLAVATAVRCADQGMTVYYAASASLLAELRAAATAAHPAGSSDPLLPAMQNDLLVLDDFGVERYTPFAEEQLTRLLSHRYDYRLPTVITTNLSQEQVTATRPRLASRIYDAANTTILVLNAPDYRAGR